jgi:hypothetical protein
LLQDTFHLSSILEEPLPKNINSIEEMQAIHDDFTEMLNDHRSLYLPTEYCNFQPPMIEDFI